jgi:hypothetical protein
VEPKKVQHQEKKKIFPFLKVAFSIINLPVHRSLFYLKIKIYAVQIMKGKEMFPVRDMLILLQKQKPEDLKITVAVDILAED